MLLALKFAFFVTFFAAAAFTAGSYLALVP